MKTLLFSILFTVTALQATEYKAVFDLTTSSADTIEKKVLHNIKTLRDYYTKRGDTFK